MALGQQVQAFNWVQSLNHMQPSRMANGDEYRAGSLLREKMTDTPKCDHIPHHLGADNESKNGGPLGPGKIPHGRVFDFYVTRMRSERCGPIPRISVLRDIPLESSWYIRDWIGGAMSMSFMASARSQMIQYITWAVNEHWLVPNGDELFQMDLNNQKRI